MSSASRPCESTAPGFSGPTARAGSEIGRRPGSLPGMGRLVLEVEGLRLGWRWVFDRTPALLSTPLALLLSGPVRGRMVHHPGVAEAEGRTVVIARTCRAYLVLSSFASPIGDIFSETARSAGAAGPARRHKQPWSARSASRVEAG